MTNEKLCPQCGDKMKHYCEKLGNGEWFLVMWICPSCGHGEGLRDSEYRRIIPAEEFLIGTTAEDMLLKEV